MRIPSDVLRLIAGAELDKLLPATDANARADLITSAVRQWLTHEGFAVVITAVMGYWVQVESAPNKIEVHVNGLTLADTVNDLRRRKDREDIRRIRWQLSLPQRAAFEKTDGVTLAVRVNPQTRRFEVERVELEDD